MTAETFDIVKRKATVWSRDRKNGGSAAANGADFASVTDVNGALDVCSAAWKTEHTVTADSIGKAQHIDAV